jgi:hypothetical protein
MVYAGLDLSRKRLDIHLLDGEGATVEVGAAAPDADGLRGLTRRFDRHGEPIRAAIESMNEARWRLHLVRHRSSLKQRVHAVLLAHGDALPERPPIQPDPPAEEAIER